MKGFIVPDLINANIPKLIFAKKIELRKKDIALTHLLSKDLGKTYKVVFLINIYPPMNIGPNLKITPRTVNMISLKKAILGNIKNYDLKYMKLINFDTQKAEFHFDLDKWLGDATSGLKSSTAISKFARTFKFKVAPPRMIMEDMLRDEWGKFILKHFKKYIEDKNKGKDYFKHLLPKEIKGKMKKRIVNMFEWQYDIQWNRVTATLKSVWILALLFAISTSVDKLTKYDMKGSKKELFADRVKKNLKNFDNLKWEKYISKKHIFDK